MNTLTTIKRTPKTNGAAIHINQNGAAIAGEPGPETVEKTMAECAQMGRTCQFVIGDLINYANAKWGEKYERWIEVSGLDYGTLANFASVCGKIPHDRRRPNLSFSHHKAVAALSDDDREMWMGAAEQHGLSQKRLAKSIQLGRVATKEDLNPAALNAPKPIETVQPYVIKLSLLLGKWEQEGMLGKLNAEQLHCLHLDLLPVMQQHGLVLRRLLDRADPILASDVRKDVAKALG